MVTKRPPFIPSAIYDESIRTYITLVFLATLVSYIMDSSPVDSHIADRMASLSILDERLSAGGDVVVPSGGAARIPFQAWKLIFTCGGLLPYQMKILLAALAGRDRVGPDEWTCNDGEAAAMYEDDGRVLVEIVKTGAMTVAMTGPSLGSGFALLRSQWDVMETLSLKDDWDTMRFLEHDYGFPTEDPFPEY